MTSHGEVAMANVGRKTAAAKAELEKEKRRVKIVAIVLVALAAAATAGVLFVGLVANQPSAPPSYAPLVVDDDVVIPTSGVTTTASFYPVQIDGERLEIFAVKASDGSARTAFNTCMDCYLSGAGVYSQSGDTLICQNCGNVFSIDQIGLASGGCNPVPIPDSAKTEENGSIKISKEFLLEQKAVFDSWKAS
jgi:uncharacterized membrane protein